MRIDLSSDEEIGVQMAPLIDCVFLLLIFFLVATSLRKIEKELPLDLPQVKADVLVSRPVDDNVTIVSIDQQGNFYLGSEPAGQGYLGRRLDEIMRLGSGHRIRIDADRSAPSWALVQVVEMCNFRGLKNVGIKAVNNPYEPPRD